jgi:hypothetical protein
VARVLVAGVLLLGAISAPASAQGYICHPGCVERKGYACPQWCIQKPPQPPPSRPPVNHRQQVDPQQVGPSYSGPPLGGLCVVPDVGSCRVLRPLGSYCECKNWIGEIFIGVVQ